jgi:septal ring factor EnvC (AmiA/AmiB activator)
MLKTYRIIPVVFILFLFGFTLITVSPVIAEDSGEVAELNARIVESQSQVATLSGQHVELQSQVATLTTTNAQLQEQLRAASAAAEPLNAKISQLEGKPMSSWECAWKRREMR